MSEFRITHKTFSWLLAAMAALGLLFGAQAVAQTDDDENEEEIVDIDRIQVTGSLLRRDEYSSAAPITVISADTKITEGLIDTADFLHSSSVAAGSTQINHQFGGFVIEGGTGVQTLSLRGLGAQRSLVLLNGRRPGPAGTRGQVAAFDLNVVPSIIIQRAEILKDGASSIYGSDAVAGVANIITRTDIDGPELTVNANMPFESGGERYSAAGATGWQFDNGNIVLAGEWYLHEPLRVGDRDFFECSEDRIHDQQGNRIDQEDRSINAGTSLEGCNFAVHNAVDEIADGFITNRFVPAPDGVTIGMIPGYRPEQLGRYDDEGGQAFYERVLMGDFHRREHVINRQERFSLYGRSDFSFNSVDWDAEFLYNRRKTENFSFRQFFPIIAAGAYADNPDYTVPVESGLSRPIMPFTWQDDIQVDYYHLSTGLEGALPFGNNWTWRAHASYSYSDGDYTRKDSIVASRTGDVTDPNWDGTAPPVDYFEPCILSGECMDDLVAALGQSHTGNTTYDQLVLTGVVGGDLFELPAGPVGLAVGAEYREFSIDDTPSDLALSGDLWGETVAGRTKGDDSVMEAFAEIEVPIISGVPGFESLSFNASGRVFDYDSVSGSDYVWKVGMNWQVVPTVRLRATRGTSYRAPGLFELFLADQTGFLGQTAIDPCVDWGQSNNNNVRTNCAALGIPEDYAGAGSTALIVTGGGAGLLEPETSDAFTAGIVFTPTFANFNVALDYWEFDIQDQIDRLGAGAILGGCFGAPNFPNAFCNLFDRNSGDHETEPYRISEVRDSYLNINQQESKGFDLSFRYDHDFAYGSLEIEGETTYVFEAVEQLFSSEEESGFETDDFLGHISRPKWVGELRTAFKRGDWTYTWFMDYVGRTRNDERIGISEIDSYFGFEDAVYDTRAGRRLYHGLSVLYDHADQWSVLAGVRNLLDEDPPLMSAGAGSTRYGNTPAFATQYDWYGRTGYVRFNYKF